MRLLIILPLILAGCAEAAGFGAAAKAKIQQGADIQAQTTLSANCAITYGAFTRLPEHQKLAVELACGGDFLDSLRRLGTD